jgi:hypothetical protein
MPDSATVEAFTRRVESGDYVGAIERYYAEDALMQENNDAPRCGRDTLMEGERRIMSAFRSITARREGPALLAGDRVAIRWRFEFTPAEGPPRVLEEIAWQEWQGDRIRREQFFYDPRQIAG